MPASLRKAVELDRPHDRESQRPAVAVLEEFKSGMRHSSNQGDKITTSQDQMDWTSKQINSMTDVANEGKSRAKNVAQQYKHLKELSELVTILKSMSDSISERR